MTNLAMCFLTGEFVIDTPQKLKHKLEMVFLSLCWLYFGMPCKIYIYSLYNCVNEKIDSCTLKVEALGEIELATKLLEDNIGAQVFLCLVFIQKTYCSFRSHYSCLNGLKYHCNTCKRLFAFSIILFA